MSEMGDGLPAAATHGTRSLVSVVRALALLDAIADSPEPVRVIDLARRLGMRRPRIHQQLVTLVDAGWMERASNGAYRLTLRAMRVGEAALQQAGIGERLEPLMYRLMAETGEVVSLAMRDGDAAVLLRRVEPERPLSANYRIGTRLSLATSASGRVIAAFSDETETAHMRAAGADLPAAGDIAEVRRSGFALATNGGADGLDAVAAPLFSAGEARVIAVSLAGPSARFDARAAAPALLRASEDMQLLLAGGTRHRREAERDSGGPERLPVSRSF
ncbi:MAG: IclR family transcriptional regulator [Solirubrobacteraceae bacterium]